MKFSYQSKVAKTANELFHSGKVTSLSEAFRLAHYAVKLRNQLKDTMVKFSFRKADGTVRQAIGTLNDLYYNYEYKGKPGKTDPSVIRYFDIERNAFRSFRVDRLTA